MKKKSEECNNEFATDRAWTENPWSRIRILSPSAWAICNSTKAGEKRTLIQTSTKLNLHVYWTPIAIVLTHRQRQYSFQIFWHSKNNWQCLSKLVLAGFFERLLLLSWYNLLLSNTICWKRGLFLPKGLLRKVRVQQHLFRFLPGQNCRLYESTPAMSRCLCRLCSVFLYNSNFWDRQRGSSLITFICRLYLHQLVEPTEPHPTSKLHSHYTSSFQCWRLPLR